MSRFFAWLCDWWDDWWALALALGSFFTLLGIVVYYGEHDVAEKRRAIEQLEDMQCKPYEVTAGGRRGIPGWRISIDHSGFIRQSKVNAKGSQVCYICPDDQRECFDYD